MRHLLARGFSCRADADCHRGRDRDDRHFAHTPRELLRLIGGQIGALLSPHLPDRLLKTVFALCVLGIAAINVVTSLDRLL